MHLTMRLLPRLLPVFVGGFASLAAATALPQDHGQQGHDHAAMEKTAPGDPYTLPTDPVTGDALGAVKDQVIINHEGRELRFANSANAKAFHASPAKYLAAVDAQMVKQQASHYPLDTCVVSGEKLGGMGDPLDVVLQNRLFRLCCKGCKGKLTKDPAKFLKKLDLAVIEKQAAKYPLKTCVVSGEALGGSMGDPIDVVMANRLVRICCKGCSKDLKKDPAAILAKLGKGAKDGHGNHDH